MSTSTSPLAGTTPVAAPSGGEGGVTLVEGQTFCLSGPSGDVSPDLPHGLFVLDTRVVSYWALRVDGHRTEPLAVDVTEPFAATFVGRAHPPEGRADAEVVVFRQRSIGAGMRERVAVTNHGLEHAPVTVELDCDVDFADLFTVKEGHARRHGRQACEVTDQGLRFPYRDAGVVKHVEISTFREAEVQPGSITWRATLPPGASMEVCVQVLVVVGGEVIEPRFRCGVPDTGAVPAERSPSWRATLPALATDHPGLASAVRRSGEDLGALRILDPDHPDVPILAAGAPWFMTMFGRDSLLTAWMTLIADPSLAQGVLETLARLQGDDVDPVTEEEPGKILHEMRFGAAAGSPLGRGPINYGSIDATPLFVMLLGELRRWHLADEVVERLLPHVDRALAWIEEHGDRDGDGYVEYQRRSEHGLSSQGWKDSWDAVRHADGELASGPVALCEVQGYVYAAYVARAHVAQEVGDTATFERWRAKAIELRRRFNQDFWLDQHGWYALALDGDKRPVDALASNMGHCLWTGIVDPDRSGRVAERLLSRELFSGWGVRTLATSMRAYNPVSYHNGSVWPHDNALCAAGLARYGHAEAAHRVIAAQVGVAQAHDGRLPELFAGFERGRPRAPAAYPTSCSPQAWAAAAPLLWLRTLLRLDPRAPHGRVWLHPELPPWLHHLRVEGIEIAGRHLTVEIDGSDVEVSGAGGLEVVATSGPPGRPEREPADTRS